MPSCGVRETGRGGLGRLFCLTLPVGFFTESHQLSWWSWMGTSTPTLLHKWLLTLAWAGAALVMLEGMKTMIVTRKAFENMLMK